MAVKYRYFTRVGSTISRFPRPLSTMNSTPRSTPPVSPQPWQHSASVGLVEPHDFSFAEPPDRMLLESGRSLGPVNLRYETYGELNAARDNTVLVFHATSGSHHAAGYHSPDDRRPGWWTP